MLLLGVEIADALDALPDIRIEDTYAAGFLQSSWGEARLVEVRGAQAYTSGALISQEN